MIAASPPPATSRITLFAVYGGLLALLALTALAAQLPAGPWSLPIALAIAFAKLGLIFYFFMHLRQHRGFVRIFAVTGFFWLAIIGTLTFADYLTRGWLF
jgi:cytochrome c oxidase subunit 4